MSSSSSSSSSIIKELKEASVTGHAGSSHPWEVLWVCSSVVWGCASYNMVIMGLWNKGSGRSLLSTTTKVLLEATLVWFPMVLAQSDLLYPYATGIMILQALFAGIGMFWIVPTIDKTISGKDEPPAPIQHQPFLNAQSSKSSSSLSSQRVLDYLTLYRSSILYLTFIAILAVDFPALFPRRFCKTEEEGYGLMDVGAASFCISAGLVGAKKKKRRQRNQQQDTTATPSTLLLWKPFLHTLPLVIIGIIRIITNQELEYQEHVTEYGVHWNFFFTLGVLTVVPAILQGNQTSQPPSIVGPLLAMILYQLALSQMEWQKFIETAPRKMDELEAWSSTGAIPHSNTLVYTVLRLHSHLPRISQFFLANREGILGCCGYLSLYFAGEWVGYHYLWNNNSSGNSNTMRLGRLALFLWGFHLVIVHAWHVPVSRRSTNLGFCSWALAHNILLLYLLRLLEDRIKIWLNVKSAGDANTNTAVTTTTTTTETIVPIIWNAVNRHGLIMFLIANLLTGLVNLTVPTLEKGSGVALVIVYGYICVVGLAAVSIDTIFEMLFSKTRKNATAIDQQNEGKKKS